MSFRKAPSLLRVLGKRSERCRNAPTDRRVKATQVSLSSLRQLNAPGGVAHSASRSASSSEIVRTAARSAPPSAAASSSSSVQGSSSTGASQKLRSRGQHACRAVAAPRPVRAWLNRRVQESDRSAAGRGSLPGGADRCDPGRDGQPAGLKPTRLHRLATRTGCPRNSTVSARAATVS